MQSLSGRRLIVFGCGYVGSALAEAALAQGVRVTALTRNPATAEALERRGVTTVRDDLAGRDWHARVSGGFDFAVNCVSSGGGGIEAYQRSYVDGMASIAAWAAEQGRVGTFVYTSSTSVYPQAGGVRVTEQSATTPASERAQLLLAAEARVRTSSTAWARWFILRLAGIYGPGRHYLLDQVKAGEVAGVPGTHLNVIHRDDIVAAILACLSAPETTPGGIFNLADDAPAPKGEVTRWLAERLGLPEPQFSGVPAGMRGGLTPDRVIVNERIKASLGWTPAYPTFRAGYGSLLSH